MAVKKLFVFFVFIFALCFPAAPVYAQDVSGTAAITLIKSRMAEKIIVTSDSIASDAKRFAESIKQDGSWEGINYATVEGLDEHLNRTLVMARHYRSANDSLFLPKIESALTYVNLNLTPDGQWNQNWWYKEVGYPVYRYGPLLIILEGKISPTLFSSSLAILKNMVGDPIRIGPAGETVGANAVWRSQGKFNYGLVSGDLRYLDVARADIERAFSASADNTIGVLPDYSYRFHGALLHMGYGKNDPQLAFDYQAATQGTVYKLPESVIRFQTDFILNGLSRVWYKGVYDYTTVGREYTRGYDSPIESTANTAALMQLVSNSSGYRANDVVSVIKSSFRFLDYTAFSNQVLVNTVRASTWPQYDLVGHFHYPYSDFTVHRNESYYVSLRMISARTESFENVNNEGLKGWHMADGHLNLTFNGKELYQNNNFPTYNWAKLPGTTVEIKNRTPGEGANQKGLKTFAGAVASGYSGVSAMDFQAYNSCLTAKKSWFFFDDQIIGLGSGINCSGSNSVQTIINQWPIKDNPSTSLSVDGVVQTADFNSVHTYTPTWIYHNTIGYYFPSSQTVKSARYNQTGSWHDINNNASTTSYTNPFLHLWIDHGANPSNKSYSYVMLPGYTLAETQAYANSNPLAILSQDNIAHAVYQNHAGMYGFVFWRGMTSAENIRGYRADKMSIVLVRYTGQAVTVAASDPTNANTTLRFTLPSILRPVNLGPGVSIESDGVNTTLVIPLSNGLTSESILTRDSAPSDFYCYSWVSANLNYCESQFERDPKPQSCITANKNVVLNLKTAPADQFRYRYATSPASTGCSDPDDSKFFNLTDWLPFTASSGVPLATDGDNKVCVQLKKGDKISPWCGGIIKYSPDTTPLECQSWQNVYLNSCKSGFESVPRSQSCIADNPTVNLHLWQPYASEFRYRQAVDPDNTICSDPDDAKFINLTDWMPYTPVKPITLTGSGNKKICAQFRNSNTTSVWCGGIIELRQNAVAGDANADGKVDMADYIIWLNHYSQSASGSSNGDFDESGSVDGADYIIWLNNYSV